MSTFKLEFKLKQHTPLIHFQHEQSGATLRATELKPKLDKFLNLKDLKLPFGEHGELKYKTRIKAKYNRDMAERPYAKDPLYFGNMGEGKDKYFVLAENNKVELAFFVFDENIKKAIEKYFAEFLMKTNFGTRQSKGFGSFYLDPADWNKYKKPEDVLKDEFYLIFKSNGDVKENIAIVYNLMKSGINYPDYPMIEYVDRKGRKKKRPDPSKPRGKNELYFKGFLFHYFLDKKIGNEKHFIKENFFRPSVRISPDSLDKKYIRSMLGVAGGVEFKDQKRRGRIVYKSDEVERFKSPILFKIIDDKVYILPQNIPLEMFKQKFEFIHEFLTNNGIRVNKKTINTPDDFDLKDFLKQYADYFNNLDRSVLTGKKGRLHDMINATEKIKIKIHEV